jgi:hypothetical protein
MNETMVLIAGWLTLGCVLGYIFRDYQFYKKDGQSKASNDTTLKIGEEIKEGGYQPIIVKIDKNEVGGYTAVVYNRRGTHLTKENRSHFVNILQHMIMKESEISNELRSHNFKLYNFKKDD